MNGKQDMLLLFFLLLRYLQTQIDTFFGDSLLLSLEVHDLELFVLFSFVVCTFKMPVNA